MQLQAKHRRTHWALPSPAPRHRRKYQPPLNTKHHHNTRRGVSRHLGLLTGKPIFEKTEYPSRIVTIPNRESTIRYPGLIRITRNPKSRFQTEIPDSNRNPKSSDTADRNRNPYPSEFTYESVAHIIHWPGQFGHIRSLSDDMPHKLCLKEHPDKDSKVSLEFHPIVW